MGDMIGALGTALQAGGKLWAGFAGSNMEKIQSDILMANSRLYSTQSETALLDEGLSFTKGAFQQGRIAQKVTATEGAETGGFAARNIDPRYGSPLVMQMITAQQGENDKALVGAQAQLEASNAVARAATIKNKAASSAWGAYSAEVKGFNDMVAGVMGAATSILGGSSGAWDFGGGGGSSSGGSPDGTGGSFDMMAGG